MLNASQVRTNRAALDDAFDVEDAGQDHRLVGDNPDRLPVQTSKAAVDGLAPSWRGIPKVTVVDDSKR